MKTRLITAALMLTFSRLLLAQTADRQVSEGRAFLSATNIVAANNRFSSAVALSPNHQTANVFYAATRLLVLPSQPAGSNFLSRIGMPTAGRDIYNWTAGLPTDTNGVPLAPAGVNANESTATLRTNVLPALIAAEANLAKVTDTNFTLTLTSNETRIVGVTLDYGDIQMLRAMLQVFEYFAYTTYSWNLDAQLAAIRSLYTNDQLSIERLVMDYSNLLTFATTNDLNAAKLAFQNGVNRYLAASQFIRNRSTNVTRLFNYDADKANDEEKFRLTLTELTNSLSTAVVLTTDTNYTVFLGAHFSGTRTLRSFLPSFRGDDFGLGTLPDSTFGGLIYGLTDQGVDEFLAKHFFPIPTISPMFSTLGGPFQFPINVAKGRGYVIQVSTNLLDWSDYSAFFAVNGGYSFADPNTAAFPRRFYRVVDRTGNMPPPANDVFANRALISNMNVPVYGYTESASLESAETNWVQGIGHTVWWTWTSPISAEVAVLASGGDNCWPIGVFTGVSLNGLAQVASDYNQVRFTAQAGVTYQIAVDTCGRDGGVKLVITLPPVLVVTSPSDGATFYPPANLLVSGSASDPDGQIRQIRIFGDFIFGDFNFNYTTTADSFSIPWTNVPGGYYYLGFVATDDAGGQTWEYRFIRVRPQNDDFTNATPISGAPLIVTGSNAGANKENGEPDHAGNSGGSSVWWSWTPTATGPVTILCSLTNQWGNGWPFLNIYTGSNVSNLTSVASNAPNYGITAVVSFAATLGQTYKIAVDSYDQGTAILQFIATAAPTVAITNPPNNATFIGPTNIQISAQASDSDGSIARVEFYADGSLIGTRFAPSYSVVWSNVAPVGYSREIVAYAVDNAGVGVFSTPINVTVQPPPPPNDNFANRITISGTNATVSGTNLGATRETGEPFHWASTGGKSVWWTWQAPKSGMVTISTAGSSFNTIMAVYTGNSVSDLALEASNDDYNDVTSRVDFLATSGTVYQIAVDGYDADSGGVSLSVSQP